MALLICKCVYLPTSAGGMEPPIICLQVKAHCTALYTLMRLDKEKNDIAWRSISRPRDFLRKKTKFKCVNLQDNAGHQHIFFFWKSNLKKEPYITAQPKTILIFFCVRNMTVRKWNFQSYELQEDTKGKLGPSMLNKKISWGNDQRKLHCSQTANQHERSWSIPATSESK